MEETEKMKSKLCCKLEQFLEKVFGTFEEVCKKWPFKKINNLNLKFFI